MNPPKEQQQSRNWWCDFQRTSVLCPSATDDSSQNNGNAIARICWIWSGSPTDGLYYVLNSGQCFQLDLSFTEIAEFYIWICTCFMKIDQTSVLRNCCFYHLLCDYKQLWSESIQFNWYPPFDWSSGQTRLIKTTSLSITAASYYHSHSRLSQVWLQNWVKSTCTSCDFH